MRNDLSWLILLLVSFAIVLEFYPISRFASPSVHPFFRELAHEKGDFAIIDLSEPHQKILSQTVHTKRLIGGYVGGRVHLPSHRLLRERNVFYWQDSEEFAAGLDWLASLGPPDVKYLVVPASLVRETAWAVELDLPLRFRDDKLTVYRIVQQEIE